MPIILAIIALVVSFLLSPSSLFAQQSSPEARAFELAQSLDKTKHKIKEKKGIRVEAYAEVRHQPVAKSNPQEYSGVYETEDRGFSLNIQVAPDGSVSGSGFDPEDGNRARGKFTLESTRIDGSVLSGVKAYENGERRKFEGVFANRTVRAGTSPANSTEQETRYGFATADEYAIAEFGTVMSRLFYLPK